jgi:hypothetical protein
MEEKEAGEEQGRAHASPKEELERLSFSLARQSDDQSGPGQKGGLDQKIKGKAIPHRQDPQEAPRRPQKEGAGQDLPAFQQAS